MIKITIDNTKASNKEIEKLAKIIKIEDNLLFSKEGISKAHSHNLSVEIRSQSASDFIKNVKSSLGQD